MSKGTGTSKIKKISGFIKEDPILRIGLIGVAVVGLLGGVKYGSMDTSHWVDEELKFEYYSVSAKGIKDDGEMVFSRDGEKAGDESKYIGIPSPEDSKKYIKNYEGIRYNKSKDIIEFLDKGGKVKESISEGLFTKYVYIEESEWSDKWIYKGIAHVKKGVEEYIVFNSKKEYEEFKKSKEG